MNKGQRLIKEAKSVKRATSAAAELLTDLTNSAMRANDLDMVVAAVGALSAYTAAGAWADEFIRVHNELLEAGTS